MSDAELRDLLARIPPDARDVLRRVARADQRERDEVSSRLLREPKGKDMAELIDRMSLSDEGRRQVARVLGELEANE
jgi:hypothetical protein